MLKQLINDKWKEYFKAGNKVGKSAFEAIKAKILIAEKSGEFNLPLTDTIIENIIIKDIKEMKESQFYYKADSSEYKELEYKISLLAEYLPKQLTEEEVIAIIKEKQQIETNTGKIIGLVVKEVGNNFDKSKISMLVKKVLSE
jgi:uncharacterized protein YqeY